MPRADGHSRTRRTAAKTILRGLWRGLLVGETPTVIVLRGVLMVPICYALDQGVVVAMGTRFDWVGWIPVSFGLLMPLVVTISRLRRSRAVRRSREQEEDDGYSRK